MSTPRPYRVSTITCNGSIGKEVEEVYLDKLYNLLPIVPLTNPTGFVYAIDRHGKEFKGIMPKKEKKLQKKPATLEEVYKKRRFDNALSSYYKLADQYFPSVKIFKNGTIQMTGVRTIEDGNQLNQEVCEVIKQLVASHPDLVKTPKIECCNFIVRLINSDFSVPFHIRRKELHQLLISNEYQNSSSFQPGTYPGVKLQYFWNINNPSGGRCVCQNKCFGKGDGYSDGHCKKITISIFESGKILITGGINFQQIDNAYDYINTVFNKHLTTLKKIELLPC